MLQRSAVQCVVRLNDICVSCDQDVVQDAADEWCGV